MWHRTGLQRGSRSGPVVVEHRAPRTGADSGSQGEEAGRLRHSDPGPGGGRVCTGENKVLAPRRRRSLASKTSGPM
jgi:hypothetical protein